MLDVAPTIAPRIRSGEAPPRRIQTPRETLAAARSAVEKHITDGYLRQVQAPVGAKPVLKAWMELN